MTRVILVGKQRRITISEFAALCKNRKEEDVSLQMLDEEEIMNPNNQDDVDHFSMSLVSIHTEEEDSLLLTTSVIIGSLTLLAFAIAQERIYSSPAISKQVTHKLIHIANVLSSSSSHSTTTTTTTALCQSLLSIVTTPLLDNTNIKEWLQNQFLPKCIQTARILLTTHDLQELIVTSSADLCIAALSVQRIFSTTMMMHSSSPQDIFQGYDTTSRPHRSSLQVATIMKLLLEGGNSNSNPTTTTATTTIASVVDNKNQLLFLAMEQIPTIHGMARDVLSNAYKTLEMESNSVDDPQGLHVQTSTQNVTLQTVEFICILLQKMIALTQDRIISASEEEEENKTKEEETNLIDKYQSLVKRYETLLDEEMTLGVLFAHEKRLLAEEEFRQKEIQKAARAADFVPAAASDELLFQGMTEAQIAKILKKRAQKKAAKPSTTDKIDILTTLFGVGISSVVKICSDPNNMDRLKQLEALVERLQRGGVQRKPKIPKGTRDFLPEQMMIRDQAFQIIRRVFKRHGAVEIDTPVFELKETLTGKYGEDSKLIYDLADQGGELLSLRYDLTVPFARFLSLHGVGNIKRFHLGKVYRRDQPALSKGRYREFYQCDFDIAGVYGRMIPDAECLAVAIEILSSLPLGCDFCLKVNHRRLLDAILDLCGVPSDKFRTICSAVDKLDKEPWEEVKREMVHEKGLEYSVADKIGTFVLQKGDPWTMYNQLVDSGMFASHVGAQEALEDMRILFDYLDAMGKLNKISFDMSLARGLDYYTGVIYEAVCIGSGNTQMGSIGGGGRYDNLVAMFQEAGKITPCVGVSVGIERVFTLMEQAQAAGGPLKKSNVTVLVASVGNKMIKERMKVAKMLWDANISAEYTQQEQPKLNKEITNALDRGVPFMAIVGEEELKENKCKIKDLNAHEEELVSMDEVVATLLRRGAIPVGCELAMRAMS